MAVTPGSPSLPPSELSAFSLAGDDDDKKGFVSPEFLVGGTSTPIPTRYILPYELVEQIAMHFVETGERKPGITWELI